MRDMLKLCISCFLFLLWARAVLVKGCIEAERNALLVFKAGLTDPNNILSSWHDKNCCSWSGVTCNNKTGRISKLNLRCFDSGECVTGDINSSLSILSDLEYLDLSGNYFSGTYIPKFIGSFKRLRYLNLSTTIFNGNFPPQLGNLSNLNYLDLRGATLIPETTFSWLSGLISLRYLDFSYANLSDVNWFHVVNTLPSLEVLHLFACEIRSMNSSFAPLNLTRLRVLDFGYNKLTHLPKWLPNITSIKSLDLSGNELSGIIPIELSFLNNIEILLLNNNNFNRFVPNTIRNFCRLNTLDMSHNNFTFNGFNGSLPQCIQENLQVLKLSNCALMGNIPRWLERMTNLVTLDLSSNSLNGTIPRWLERMKDLITLDLSSNSLNGSIPEGVWKLPHLTELFLGQNIFEGVVTELHLGYLRSVKILNLSNNKLVVQSDNWHPNFGLEYVGLDSCQIGPKFPSWLQGQTQLMELHLSNNNIVDTLPLWFWNITHSLSYLDLSNNQIKGELAFSLLDTKLELLNLSFNLIEGPLQVFTSSYDYYFLLDLRNNNIVGSIPSTICEFSLQYVLLSNNKLSGELPECLGYPNDSDLMILDLSNNNFSGNISSFFSSDMMQVLKLNNNFFSGELPIFFRGSSPLIVLDLGVNKFVGTIPTWIGESLKALVVLNLRSNMISGSIPSQLGLLQSLQILDLSHNNLSGIIPMTIGKFSQMVNANENLGGVVGYSVYGHGPVITVINYYYYLSLTIKDETLIFSKTLSLMTSIDISNNSLSGEIPDSLGNLRGLDNLNLSNNHLSGKIPQTIGKMKLLQSLDLSINRLSGSIPQTLSDLTFLSLLNLSYNNLSGVIPTGNQLQTLNDPSIYKGNPFLCGPPISNSCTVSYNKTTYNSDTKHENDGSDWLWLYIGTVYGFIAGFWFLFGILMLKRDWRYAYISVIDALIDRVYVAVALFLNRLRNLRK